MKFCYKFHLNFCELSAEVSPEISVRYRVWLLGVLLLWAPQNLRNLVWVLPTFFLERARIFSLGVLIIAATAKPHFLELFF